MSTMIDGNQLRKVLLEVIKDISERKQGSSLQSGLILDEAARKLEIRRNTDMEQALLTYWYDLFRTGHMSWGHNLLNADPPFCHLTEHGRKTLETISRDPANPDGYMNHITAKGSLNPTAQSYIEEALKTYNVGCFKATAVMVGAASESLVLETRDTLIIRIQKLGKSPPRKLKDWKIKTILDTIKQDLDAHKGNMPRKLSDTFDAYWPAFTQQIRAARNDAGHPTSIQPVTEDTVHASLLILPELVDLVGDLQTWIAANYN
jgi:hypothetical protein